MPANRRRSAGLTRTAGSRPDSMLTLTPLPRRSPSAALRALRLTSMPPRTHVPSMRSTGASGLDASAGVPGDLPAAEDGDAVVDDAHLRRHGDLDPAEHGRRPRARSPCPAAPPRGSPARRRRVRSRRSSPAPGARRPCGSLRRRWRPCGRRACARARSTPAGLRAGDVLPQPCGAGRSSRSGTSSACVFAAEDRIQALASAPPAVNRPSARALLTTAAAVSRSASEARSREFTLKSWGSTQLLSGIPAGRRNWRA